MPSKVSSEQPLIFDWDRARSRLGRLILALVVVLLGLGAFFYVFRVVPPQSERFTPVPHQVVLLNTNSADPAARAIMNKVRDVDFLLLPQRGGADNGVALQDHAPVFHPSFEGHELKLQDLPHRPFTAPPPRLLDVDEPTLPPLDLSELKASKSLGSAASSSGFKAKPVLTKLRMRFHGLPEERLPRSLPDLAEVPPMDPTTWRFKVGVAADGRVAFALPMTTPDMPEAANLLTERVRRLRFAPLDDAKAGVQWGEVSFEWSDAP